MCSTKLVTTVLKCSNDQNEILERFPVLDEIRFLSFFFSFFVFFLNAALFGLAVLCVFSFHWSQISDPPLDRSVGSHLTRPSASPGLSVLTEPVPPSLCWSAAPACCFLSMFSRCLLLFRWPAARQPPTEPPSDPLHPADVDVKAAALTH